MAKFFRRSRQSYDFPLAERAEEPAEAESTAAAAVDSGDDNFHPSTDQLQQTLSGDNLGGPPTDEPKKTRKDFFLCIGILLVFTIICLAGVLCLGFLVLHDGPGGKGWLLDSHRKDGMGHTGRFDSQRI